MKKLAFIGLMVLSTAAAAQDVKKQPGLLKYEFDKYVASGRKTLVGFGHYLHPDCSSEIPVSVTIKTKPEHGTVETADGKYFDTSFPKCTDSLKGVLIYYKSADGYTGTDAFDASILLPMGVLQEIHYTVNVSEAAKNTP